MARGVGDVGMSSSSEVTCRATSRPGCQLPGSSTLRAAWHPAGDAIEQRAGDVGFAQHRSEEERGDAASEQPRAPDRPNADGRQGGSAARSPMNHRAAASSLTKSRAAVRSGPITGPVAAVRAAFDRASAGARRRRGALRQRAHLRERRGQPGDAVDRSERMAWWRTRALNRAMSVALPRSVLAPDWSSFVVCVVTTRGSAGRLTSCAGRRLSIRMAWLVVRPRPPFARAGLWPTPAA